MAVNPNITKRIQINKTQGLMLAVVIGASVLTVFALVASKTYFEEASYLGRVAREKEKAVKQLKANKAAVSTLVSSYKSFAGQNPNLIGGNATANGERDGDNGRLVLDALPSKYDFPALTTSVEKLLTGYSINSITGSDDVATQAADTTTQPVAMPFTLDVTADYVGAQTLITKFEKSIRPFQFNTLELNGTNDGLHVIISAKTYFQPERDLKINMKVVK